LSARSRQAIFSETFQANRGCYTHPRRDKGVKRGLAAKAGSEAQFLRRRRLCTGVAAAAAKPATSVEAALEEVTTAGGAAGEDLEEKQEKVLRSAADKRDSKKVQALLEGALADAEVTPELRAAAAKELERRTERAKTRRNKAVRVAAAVGPKPSLTADVQLQSHKCFIDHVSAEVDRELRGRLPGRLTTQREEAQIFIASDLLQLGQRSRWCAVLNGALVVTPMAFKGGGNLGPALKYKPASTVKRWVHITADFKTRHTEITNILHALRRPKWTFVEGLEAPTPVKTHNL
jgi:hypothetical protein